MKYIRENCNFTVEADAWFRIEVSNGRIRRDSREKAVRESRQYC